MNRGPKPICKRLGDLLAALRPSQKWHRNRRRRRFDFRSEHLEVRQLLTISFELVADLNTEPSNASSSPSAFTHADGHSFFMARTAEAGYELWRTDGTAPGTWLAGDFAPGPQSSYAGYNAATIGDQIYLPVGIPVTGVTELWKASGVAPAVEKLTWDNQGESILSPQSLTVLDGSLYFTAVRNNERRLYRLSTDPGSFPVEISTPNSLASSVRRFQTPDRLYIAAYEAPYDPDEGMVLLAIEKGGMEATVVGRYTSLLIWSRNLGNQLLFSAKPADSPDGPSYLWTSDGTTDGTRIVDLPGGSHRVSLTAVNESEFMFLRQNEQDIWELWHTDLTVMGTSFQFQIGNSSPTQNLAYVSSGNMIYFVKDAGTENARLWQTDGTTDGTVPITDPATLQLKQNSAITGWNDGVLFRARAEGSSRSDFYYHKDSLESLQHLPFDVDESVEVSVVTIAPGSDRVYFAIETPHQGTELWSTNGFEPIALVRDIAWGTRSSSPVGYVRRGNEFLFAAFPPASEGTASVLGRSDGTAAGTFLTDKTVSGFNYLVTADGRVYLEESEESEVFTLAPGSDEWTLTRELSPGPANSDPDMLATIGEMLLFTAHGEDGDRDLWISDGSELGTFRLMAADGTSFRNARISIAGKLRDDLYVFSRNLDHVPRELWVTDGTAQGTRLLFSHPGVAVFSGGPMTATLPGQIVFFVVHPNFGRQLWTTDGTAEGTQPLKNIWAPWAANNELLRWTSSAESNVAYFLIGADYSRIDLWKTDGTAEGTDRVLTIKQASSDAILTTFLQIDNQLYFVLRENGDASNTDRDTIWVTDGTVDGTRPIRSDFLIESFPWPSGIGLYSEFGQLFFNANDGINGRQLWMSDGSSSGTQMLTTSSGDFPPFSTPGHVIGLKGDLYYPGLTDEFGYELIRISSNTIEGVPGQLQIRRNDGPVVSWREVFGAEGYEIEITDLRDSLKPAVVIAVTSSEWRPDAVYQSGIFGLRVRAVRNDGSQGEWSADQLKFTLEDRPQLLPIPALRVVQPPVISWINRDAVAQSEIWISNLNTRTLAVRSVITGTSIQPTPAQLPPSRYAVWIRSIGDTGLSEWSEVSTFTVFATPPLITELTENSSRGLTVSWTAVDGADDYEVYIQKAGSGAAYRLLTGLGAVTSASVTEALPDSRYTIWVRALRTGRPHSPWSNSSVIAIQNAPVPRWTSSRFEWNAIDSAAGYEFELRNSFTGQILDSGIVDGTSIQPSPALLPGHYRFTLRTLFVDGTSSAWATLTFEIFHPTVVISPAPEPTVDATPVIHWQLESDTATFEVYISVVGQTAAAYRQTQIRGTNHRIALPLTPNHYRVWVRAEFPDGSRSLWGSGELLKVGDRPIVSAAASTVSWTPVRDATHYEIQVQRWNPTTERFQNYLLNDRVLTTSVSLSSGSNGRFRVWVRALRNEAGDTYRSLWSVETEFFI